MGVFSTTTNSGLKSQTMLSDALAISTYAYHNIDNGFSSGYANYGFKSGLPLTLLTALIGNTESQGGILGIPWNPDSEVAAQQDLNQAGWTVIGAETLGYSGKINAVGTFYGETEGYTTAQAEVLGKYDGEGHLTQIGIAFRGSSGPREELVSDLIGDIIADVSAAIGPEDYSDRYTLNAFDNLLEAVKDFALQQGLDGEDVVVSGHSLGGLATNSMAAMSDAQWDGFYAQSQYIAFASPTQYEKGEKVLNLGFENDPVYRSLDGTDFTLASLGAHDAEHPSTADNIVNFNDYYASDLWNLLPFSIVNVAAWLTHLPFFYQDSFARIVNSDFYNLTERDSTIVVSNLSDASRENTWVSDLNRDGETHTGPTFILGTDKNDRIHGGAGNDYLEGRGGDDIFRDDGGYNIILGGEGINKLDLQHSISGSEIAYDGATLYLRDTEGGITQASDIRSVISHEKLLWLFGYEQENQVTLDGLLSGDKLTAWAASINGDTSDNYLTSVVEGGWMFGGEGNDTLQSNYDYTTFVGGAGNDVLVSSGKGNTYLFSGQFGNDVITNLNASDKVIFQGVEGANQGDFHDNLSWVGNDLVLTYGDNSVTFSNIDPAQLDAASLIFA